MVAKNAYSIHYDTFLFDHVSSSVFGILLIFFLSFFLIFLFAESVSVAFDRLQVILAIRKRTGIQQSSFVSEKEVTDFVGRVIRRLQVRFAMLLQRCFQLQPAKSISSS